MYYRCWEASMLSNIIFTEQDFINFTQNLHREMKYRIKVSQRSELTKYETSK